MACVYGRIEIGLAARCIAWVAARALRRLILDDGQEPGTRAKGITAMAMVYEVSL